MIQVLEGQSFASGSEFSAALNKARLANKKQWLTYVGNVAGKVIELKTYDYSYLQIFRIDGLGQSTSMDMTPTKWREFITKCIGPKA